MNTAFPSLGFGLGLRPEHYPYIFEHTPKVDWFEIITENFMDTYGKPKRNLCRIKERYPLVMHGVSLSIGTVDPLNSEYLKKLKSLIDFTQPAWISDHLCWTGVAHRNTHDLLPVPYTEEALEHIIGRIKQVQDYLERPIALENPSTYLEFKASHMPEAEFIARMVEESGCNLLLDVNNVYVTCYNHRLDAKAYIDTLPLDRLIQIHLSGHSNHGTHIIDTHDNRVADEVWQLYKYVIHRAGRMPNIMVEWDDKIPPFDVLYGELSKARVAAKDAANYAPLPDLAREQLPQRLNREMPLLEAQTHLQYAIMLGKSFDSQPDAWIRGKEQFPPQEQLDVYINAYRWRLQDAVAEDYPVLKTYLGEARFAALIKDFVESEHSEHFNIGRYALKLSDFTKNYFPQDRFAHELCLLETAISQLTDPEETEALTPERLQHLTPDALLASTLKPRTALQLRAFSYPVNAYYRAINPAQTPVPPPVEASYLAVFRHDDIVWRMDLDEQEYRMLEMLFGGCSIGEALNKLMQAFPQEEAALSEKLSGWFARWMRNHLLSNIESNMKAYKGDTHEAA